MKIDLHRIVVFLGTVWGLTFVLLMIDTNLSDPTKFERSDYVMHFYIAGYVVGTGQASILYPTPNDPSLAESPFNQIAHSLLPHLSKDAISVFGYSPLLAWVLFQPLSKFRPHISLLVWQVISIVALIFSAVFLSRASKVKSSDILFLSSLFLPIIATLWSGQLSLVVGLFPLSAGYFLLRKNHPAVAGFVWSFLILKPQFLPVAAFVAFALALSRRFECIGGIALGIIGITAANMTVVPVAVSMNWLYSVKLIEFIFSSGSYEIPTHLMTCLPVNLLLALPIESRATFKWFTYSAAALLWLAALWKCKKTAESNLDESLKIPLILTVGIFLLPLTSPRLLYYDLCLFLPAGVILLGKDWLPSQSVSLKRIALIGWMSISVYMLVFMNVAARVELPLVLEFILLILFADLLRRIDRICVATQEGRL